ncbi:LysR family transcriptional regulator [Planctobacterium marinum]|uniref:HTH-type transcriptional regulator YwqM n=1 Tax=Planctobacterium marinum TaxID=1631968 RepID=A0AA48KT47_9ALTE|nr:putative HTH-type transcriptional regulator YwqM [Planctobacterium marinum]
MDFKKLRTFRIAAQLQNFSDASSHLGYVQSAVTSQIKSLEEELETPLFRRNGRGVSLTEAGNKLLEYCDKLFSLREEATLAVKGQTLSRQLIRIAGYETILTYRLPYIIHDFNQQYPEVQLQIQPVGVKQLRQLILTDQADIAFIFDELVAGQSQPIAGLQQIKLGSEEIVVIAAADHPLAQQQSLTINDLAGHTLLLTEQGCYYRNHFEKALIQAGAFTGTLLEFTSIEAIKACVRTGTGIGAISKVSVQPQLDTGEIVALPIKDLSLSVDLLLVSKQEQHNEIVHAFIQQTQKLYYK